LEEQQEMLMVEVILYADKKTDSMIKAIEGNKKKKEKFKKNSIMIIILHQKLLKEI
jgi:excinuclease UvrABC helicase subunit UvrB